MMGARAALIGLGGALTDLQARLLAAYGARDVTGFLHLSSLIDAFGIATFATPIEGYVRRMLWALAADGVLPADACDDPWGPDLRPEEREVIAGAVRQARAAA
jgi:4-hydroxy-tetrahydrodipicolinate synthase